MNKGSLQNGQTVTVRQGTAEYIGTIKQRGRFQPELIIEGYYTTGAIAKDGPRAAHAKLKYMSKHNWYQGSLGGTCTDSGTWQWAEPFIITGIISEGSTPADKGALLVELESDKKVITKLKTFIKKNKATIDVPAKMEEYKQLAEAFNAKLALYNSL